MLQQHVIEGTSNNKIYETDQLPWTEKVLLYNSDHTDSETQRICREFFPFAEDVFAPHTFRALEVNPHTSHLEEFVIWSVGICHSLETPWDSQNYLLMMPRLEPFQDSCFSWGMWSVIDRSLLKCGLALYGWLRHASVDYRCLFHVYPGTNSV